jgi:hypothetical protein
VPICSPETAKRLSPSPCAAGGLMRALAMFYAFALSN